MTAVLCLAVKHTAHNNQVILGSSYHERDIWKQRGIAYCQRLVGAQQSLPALWTASHPASLTRRERHKVIELMLSFVDAEHLPGTRRTIIHRCSHR